MIYDPVRKHVVDTSYKTRFENYSTQTCVKVSGSQALSSLLPVMSCLVISCPVHPENDSGPFFAADLCPIFIS